MKLKRYCGCIERLSLSSLSTANSGLHGGRASEIAPPRCTDAMSFAVGTRRVWDDAHRVARQHKARQSRLVTGAVPEIDSLAVRVVVDSYQFAVAPSKKIGDVAVQHFGWGLEEGKPPGRTLVSEFGLSMHVETHRGAETRNTLVDFGFTPEALVTNVELLGIDPSKLDALVLSHGHYDHFGGLVGFLQRYNGKLKPNLPFYVGGEEAFCSREWVAPPVKGDFGVLDRKALQEANLSVTYTDGPSLVADHGFTSGQIGLTSFEKLLSPTTMKIGPITASAATQTSCPKMNAPRQSFPTSSVMRSQRPSI